MTTTATEPDGQVPPHDIDAEQIVLGAAMLDAHALREISEIAQTLDFYRPAHQIIFQLLLEQHDNGLPLDPRAINAELVKRGDATRVGGAVYLHTLVESAPTATNGAYYARIVAAKADLRRLVEAGTSIAQYGYQGEGESSDLQERASQTLEQAIRRRNSAEGDTERLGDGIEAYLDRLAQPLGDDTAVPLPYKDLQDLTGGLKHGELVTVAGRTGAGKSVFALDVARHAAIRRGLPVLYVSLEMSKDLVRTRAISAEARVPLHAMINHGMDESDWESVSQVIPQITAAPLSISTPDACSLAVLRQRLKAMERAGEPARLLVVDYVGLMTSADRAENRYNEVSAYSRGLKRIAMEFDIPVLMLCQVNRGAVKREDGVPRLSDLRDSGAIEQDSDLVVIVHREDLDAEGGNSPRQGEVDLHVAKHRSGPRATVTAASQLHYSRFFDMASG